MRKSYTSWRPDEMRNQREAHGLTFKGSSERLREVARAANLAVPPRPGCGSHAAGRGQLVVDHVHQRLDLSFCGSIVLAGQFLSSAHVRGVEPLGDVRTGQSTTVDRAKVAFSVFAA